MVYSPDGSPPVKPFTDPAGRSAPILVGYKYEVRVSVVIRKKTIPSIRDCRGHLEGMSDQALDSSTSNDFPTGRMDKAYIYTFKAERKTEAKKGTFSIRCEGVISDAKSFDIS